MENAETPATEDGTKTREKGTATVPDAESHTR